MSSILIIDDDTVLLKLYSTKLITDKHLVYTATNGEEGLKLLQTVKPDLFVLDLLMPKINGFALLETINQDPVLKNIPKIVFSSVANQEQIERLHNLGVKIYLNKIDTTPTQLVNIINQLLVVPVPPAP